MEKFTHDIRLTEGHILQSTDGYRYTLFAENTDGKGVPEFIVAYTVTDTSIYLVQMTALDRDYISSNDELPEEVIVCGYHEFNHLTDRNTLHVNSAEWLESLRNEIPDLASAADFKTLNGSLDLYCLQRVSWD